jgi:hypothetical protein
MLADHADACNRGTRHVVEGSAGLSVVELFGMYTSKPSGLILLICS